MQRSQTAWAFGAALITLAAILVTTAFTKPTSALRGEVEVNAADVPKQTVRSWSIPRSFYLAGEAVPITQLDVREKLDRELIVNTYWHSNAMLIMKRAHRWFPVIEPILEEEGLPEDFKYLAVIESGLTNAVSPAGATGFWQFLKSTGRKYNMEVTEQVDERYHLEKATRGACAYLKSMHAKYGSWALAAASYNMGPGALDKRLAEQKVETYWDLLLNAETGRYVYRILAVKQLFANPADYGFILDESDLYPTYQTASVKVTSSIPNLADWALEQGINYKILKTLNPWLRAKSLTVSSGKSYAIQLPVDPAFMTPSSEAAHRKPNGGGTHCGLPINVFFPKQRLCIVAFKHLVHATHLAGRNGLGLKQLRPMSCGFLRNHGGEEVGQGCAVHHSVCVGGKARVISQI